MDEVLKANRKQSAQRASLISIRGAREHNLKGVDLEIPRDKLVVFTGLSGSGKSSLAFDTIYAEGQRRYVESLSAYARQFLEMMQKPDVDQIDGLSPAISIEQKTTSKNPRSTVGDRHRDLRLHAPALGARRRALLAGDRPADRKPDRQPDGRPGAGAARRHAALPAGAGGARPQGRVPQGARRIPQEGLSAGQDRRRRSTSSTDAPVLDKKFPHDIDVVVDRIVVRPDIAAAPGRELRDRAEAGRRPRRGRVRRCAGGRRAAQGEKKTAKIHDKSGPSACCSRRSSPARSPASPSPRSSRGCSRSTTPTAPARPAAASASSSTSIRTWWCRTRT